MMDRLMQRIYDTKNAHLFSVASALAAIQESRAEKALSSDGRVLRELLESAEDLKAHGLVSPEDMAHMAALCTAWPAPAARLDSVRPNPAQHVPDPAGRSGPEPTPGSAPADAPSGGA